MPAGKTSIRLFALLLACLIGGLPAPLSGGSIKRFPKSFKAGSPTSTPSLPRGPGSIIPAASFPTHPLATAPAAAAGSNSLKPSDDPRGKIIATRLAKTMAKLGVGQETAAKAADRAQDEGLAKLRARAGSRFAARFRRSAGTPRFVRGQVLEGRALAATPDPQVDLTTARRFLSRNQKLLALDDPDAELDLVKIERDQIQRTHLRFTQRYAGLEVWPADLVVHLDPLGNVDLMNGAYVATPRNLGTQPKLSAAEAAQKARTHVEAPDDTAASSPDLIVYAPGDRPARLAWRLVVQKSIRFDMLVVVDAEDGEILTSFNRSQTANVAGSGTDLLGQARGLNVWAEGGQFYLTDTSKLMFDPTSNPPEPDTTRGAILILDAMNQPPTDDPQSLPENPAIVRSNSATSGWLADGVSAAANFSAVYDYFLTSHGRNSLDGSGGSVLAMVRLGRGFNNAFFMPGLDLMAFGDGVPYAAALDVVAHELTHGVTSHSSNLIYQDQPGAINESMSDIFGEMVEGSVNGAPDWIVGSVLPQPLRSLSDPGSLLSFLGRPYPEKMSEFIQTQEDSGGVHINSSIPNHAFYQLAAGLPGAIGPTDAAAIFHRANTVHLTQNSQFIDARLACIQSAEELFGVGSAQAQRTVEAFDFVEIFDSEGSPDPPTFPGTEGDDATLFLFWDSFGNSCSFFGGEYCLGRMESGQGDPVVGTLLGSSPVSGSRVSISADGRAAVFVNSVYDVCFINTSSGTEECLLLPNVGISVFSVAGSPSGRFFGFVLYDAAFEPSNFIKLLDSATGLSFDFELLSPTLGGGAVAHVAFADAIDFTVNDQYMIYDAFNEISLATGETLGTWSIYAIDVFSRVTYGVVPPFPYLDFGFPSLSQRSDNFLTFDVYDRALGESTIYAMNLDTGLKVPVGITDGWGIPAYTGDDTAIVFSQDDAYSGQFTILNSSLVAQPLGPDFLSPQGARFLWLADADFGAIYRRGVFDPTPLAECEDGRDNDQDGLIDFPADPGCESASDPIEATAADSDGDGIPDGSDNCPNNPNPDQSNYDGDFQGDACDADDDNDGTPDTSDAFPFDSTEWLDTDGDGTGNNADLDDDGDGYADTIETAAGSDPLAAASIPVASLATFSALGGYAAYLAEPTNTDVRLAGFCDEAASFAHWRDFGFAEARTFAAGRIRTDNLNGAPDSNYAIDGGFAWEYPGANTVVFITADAPKPNGWAGLPLLLERCQTFNIGAYYNAQAYRSINTDVGNAIDQGLVPSFQSVTDHYVKYGFKEGRLTNNDWTLAQVNTWSDPAYLAMNPDVANYFQGAANSGWSLYGKYGFAHWINFGQYEGRGDGQ